MQTMRILDTSNIQPLDVILGRTAGTAGKAIAKTTGGNYSHAALVIDRSCVFESGLAGVTFRPLDIVSAGFVGGKVVIGVNVADFDVIDIWRHPDLRTMETDALASLRSEALDVAALHNCREYPSLETFRNYITGKYPRRGNRMMELMKAKIPRKEPVVPGPYCSMLVVEIFTALGLPLTFPAREDNLIFPNDLARSGLEQIPVESADPMGPDRNDTDLCTHLNATLNGLRESLSTYADRRELYRDVSLYVEVVEGALTDPEIDTVSEGNAAYISALREAHALCFDAIRLRELGRLGAALRQIDSYNLMLAKVETCHETCETCGRPSACTAYEWTDVPTPGDPPLDEILQPYVDVVDAHVAAPDQFFAMLDVLRGGSDLQRGFAGFSEGTALSLSQCIKMHPDNVSEEQALAELADLEAVGVVTRDDQQGNPMFTRTASAQLKDAAM